MLRHLAAVSKTVHTALAMQDLTGQPVSLADIESAERAIKSALVKSLPPELAVELPNVLRCLRDLRALRQGQQ